jgi:hypothetical protein
MAKLKADAREGGLAGAVEICGLRGFRVAAFAISEPGIAAFGDR